MSREELVEGLFVKAWKGRLNPCRVENIGSDDRSSNTRVLVGGWQKVDLQYG